MMYHGVREITKEIYDRNKERGVLSREDEEKVFSEAEIWGYGIYGTRVYAGDDGKYYVRYERGESCD